MNRLGLIFSYVDEDGEPLMDFASDVQSDTEPQQGGDDRNLINGDEEENDWRREERSPTPVYKESDSKLKPRKRSIMKNLEADKEGAPDLDSMMTTMTQRQRHLSRRKALIAFLSRFVVGGWLLVAVTFILCGGFASSQELQVRQYTSFEVSMANASLIWLNFTCKMSASGLCTSVGRVTPDMYGQLVAAVNVSVAPQLHAPPLLSLQDCNFVCDTLRNISSNYCPPLEHDSRRLEPTVSEHSKVVGGSGGVVLTKAAVVVAAGVCGN
ncbi:hypothetical protein RHMOL_Rhmol09G0139000 [Rhododendron molle]|uniref:Uncharacterized protein n=1 Tax=Rhododendron molle TaxID=49168 RepID=A0ACC0ME64_RHOML|nr:hypothetical protein RHMOL_Rhmol09G0139000 [Rhododendron molle]